MSVPLIQGYQEDVYSVFLADLNNHMNESKKSQMFLSYQHCRTGEVSCRYLAIVALSSTLYIESSGSFSRNIMGSKGTEFAKYFRRNMCI